MKIKVLGCYGAELPGYRTSTFLINESLLLDAGTIGAALSLEDQLKIRYILLSHVHLDHIKGIPFFADNISGKISAPVTIISISEIIDNIKEHLLNDVIWPDFTKIPDKKRPVLKFMEIAEGERVRLDNLCVIAIKVNHPIPTVGYIIQCEGSSILYSGDTTNTERIWEEARGLKDLKGLIIETSFPDRMKRMADLSGHLTPQGLREELSKLKGINAPVFIYHMKPQYIEELRKEINSLGSNNVIFLEDDKEYEI